MSSKQFRRGSKELINFNSQHDTPRPNSDLHQSSISNTLESCTTTSDNVHSFCDQIQNMGISTLVTAIETPPGTDRGNMTQCGDEFSETDGIQTMPLKLRSTEASLFNHRHPDLVNVFEESSETPHSVGSTIFLPTRIVHAVRMHGKLPSFEKHSERIVPNPWRRYGARAKLSEIGGWAVQRKHSVTREVKQNDPCPRAPNTPQMSLHRDANPANGRLPIHFDIPNRTVPGDVAAMQLAVQLANRVEGFWQNKPWFDKKYSHTDAFSDNLIDMQKAEKMDSSRSKSSSTTSCGTAVSGYFTTNSDLTESNSNHRFEDQRQ